MFAGDATFLLDAAEIVPVLVVDIRYAGVDSFSGRPSTATDRPPAPVKAPQPFEDSIPFPKDRARAFMARTNCFRCLIQGNWIAQSGECGVQGSQNLVL